MVGVRRRHAGGGGSRSPSPAAPAVAAPFRYTGSVGAMIAVLLITVLIGQLNDTNLEGLAGKRVVITGSSQGIGEQMAYVHCSAGASVLLVARSQAKLDRVAEECRRRSPSADAPITVATLSADLSDVDDCGAKVISAAKAELGGLDILILNHIVNSGSAYDSRGWLAAGGGEWKQQLAILRETFDVNTFSFVALATAAMPELEASGGAIVAVSSMAGKMGLPAVAVYSGSKHALHGFFDSLRHDLINSGSTVSVTTAVLGSIDTESARKGTALPDGTPALPNVAWAPADECAAAIAKGGMLRSREVHYPVSEIGISVLLRPFLPDTLDRIVRTIMSPVPLAEQVSATAGSLLLAASSHKFPSFAELQVGGLLVAAVYGTCLILHCLVPAREFCGYVLDSDGRPLVYRLNGLRVLILMVVVLPIIVQLLSTYRADDPISSVLSVLRLIGEHYHAMLCASCVLGFSLSAMLYARGATLHRRGSIETTRRCSARGSGNDISGPCPQFLARGAVEHFYCGWEFNPQWSLLGSQIDGKMFLYLAGAVMLTLHLLAGAALHGQRWEAAIATSGSSDNVTVMNSSGCMLSRAMTVYLCCFGWFCTEYLYFEDVHTFTYDLFAERLGFKLVWGCLCFYPHFYCIGVWSMLNLTDPADDLSQSTALAIVLLFFFGWCFTRGANLQKFWHKCVQSSRTADAETGGLETLHEYVATHPAGILVEFASSSLGWHGLGDTVPGSGGRLLCSGWWGLSRHVNYFGEIMQAVALALPGYLTTGSILPWLYPLYYVALFLPRQVEDDEACELKWVAEHDANDCPPARRPLLVGTNSVLQQSSRPYYGLSFRNAFANADTGRLGRSTVRWCHIKLCPVFTSSSDAFKVKESQSREHCKCDFITEHHEPETVHDQLANLVDAIELLTFQPSLHRASHVSAAERRFLQNAPLRRFHFFHPRRIGNLTHASGVCTDQSRKMRQHQRSVVA